MPDVDTGLNCPECRAPLQTADLTHICPICGLRMADALDLRAVDMTTGQIAADVACVKCQYNLRTIPVGSVCPECGTPAVKSLTRDELRWANADWLRKTRFGLGAVALACVMGMITEVYGQAQQWVWTMGSATFELQLAISLTISVAGLTTWCVGCVGVTHPEAPDQARQALGRNRLLRIFAYTTAVMCGLMWVYPPLHFLWIQGWTRMRASSLQEVYSAPGGMSAINVVIAISYSSAAIAGAFLLNLILRSLAHRANATTLRKILTLLFVLLAINSMASMGIRLLVAVLSRSQAWSYYSWLRMAYCAESCSNVPVAIITLTACLRLRSRFRQALRERPLSGPGRAQT